MGRKKTKKLDNSSSCPSILSESSSSTFSSHSSILCENSLNNSILYEDSLVCHFKVQLSSQDEYSKWTKNCYWKNIAFIQPSLCYDLVNHSLVLIQGRSNSAAFIVQPLKSIKNRNVVLVNGTGFNNEETVTFQPFQALREAKEIFFESSPTVIPQDILTRKLSNKFIWSGLKLQFELFDVKSECVVSKVLSNEEYYQDNCLTRNQIIDDENFISSRISTLSLQDSSNRSTEFAAATVDCFITNYLSSAAMSDGLSDMPLLLFKHLGGCHQQIEIIKNFIDKFLNNCNGAVQSCSYLLLLSGPPKSGKNMTVNAFCNEYNKILTVRINMLSLACRNLSAAMEEMNLVMKNASKRSPHFLVLEKFDQFSSLKTNVDVSNLLRHLKEICGNHVLLIVSLCSQFDKQVLDSLFLVQEVKFTLPQCAFDREEVIKKILNKLDQDFSSSQIKYFAELMEGLSSGEMFRILKFDATLLSRIRKKNTLLALESDLSNIETAIKKRKKILSPQLKSNEVRWHDIVGMESIKKDLLEELVLLTQTAKETLQRFNYSPSRGILLYGPPGCSKTMIAKALATECNFSFISKKASDIMNMYVGESEKAVTNLFVEARLRSPCIIFLDEIDAIAPSRNSTSGTSGVQNRVVNCLLTEMSGIETLNDVLVLAATNRPDIIDEALLRPGRFGKLVYIPLPDPITRHELFRLSMKKRQFSDDIDFGDLVARTEGYTGAEIIQLCNEATMQLLIEDCESLVLNNEHFERALIAVPPRTQKNTIHFYEQFGSKR